jgi:hypothetical protein
MKRKVPASITRYKKNNPKMAKMISMAVKKGAKQYAETFRRLATT